MCLKEKYPQLDKKATKMFSFPIMYLREGEFSLYPQPRAYIATCIFLLDRRRYDNSAFLLSHITRESQNCNAMPFSLLLKLGMYDYLSVAYYICQHFKWACSHYF